ncbi:MAG: 2-amino-4-hydroxy-6-hydroxymethyldihydropteridine diphosphokinase [Verrucomicrobiota bacterium]|nr:2-amino-4-hydroxy-6-hydroxymethyldihydropteridine diphosphokinase [Verrucomicrobiota bacterium]
MNATRAGIALGSNLGDRLAQLRSARDVIVKIAGVAPPVLQSAIYETTPVACEPGAQNFYNAVIEIGFAMSADALFAALREIEGESGRVRSNTRNFPRTLDLDLLYFGDARSNAPALRLPHPRMATRAFVLRPLADIAPDLKLPGETATVRELLSRLPAEEMNVVTRVW